VNSDHTPALKWSRWRHNVHLFYKCTE